MSCAGDLRHRLRAAAAMKSAARRWLRELGLVAALASLAPALTGGAARADEPPRESPVLAAAVARGELPRLEDRLPARPRVMSEIAGACR